MDHYHCGACVTCVTERRTVAVQMQDELWAIGVGAVASLDPSFPGPLSGILGSTTREATHERQKVLRLRRASQLAALAGLNLSEHVKKRLKLPRALCARARLGMCPQEAKIRQCRVRVT